MSQPATTQACTTTGVRSPLAAAYRSHPRVLDRTTGAWVSLDEFLAGADRGDIVEHKRVALRLELVEGIQRYVCPRCSESMTLAAVALKRRDADLSHRFYFKHQFENGRCDGIEGLGEKAINALRFNHTKESAEHKRFKARLVESLEADASFSQTDVEARFVDGEGSRWRQPDVQTVVGGKRIAFEAQLSTTFLHVIAERMAFYVRNDAMLLWLFRDLAVDDFRQSEEDIFYANNRNAFCVTEETVAISKAQQRFALECVWLEPVVEGAGHLRDRECRRIVFFDELCFDVATTGAPRAYLFDYDAAKVKASKEADGFGLRRRFEAYWLRGETDRDEWNALRRQLLARGIVVPEWPLSSDGLPQLVSTLYSVKHWRVVGARHANLVAMAHYLFNQRKGFLRLFHHALNAYGRVEAFKSEDVGKSRFSDKAAKYLPRLRARDPEFALDGRHADLAMFLFPELPEEAFH